MQKLINEVLNSENVIEKCCELEILKRNWKLLLFDSGVDNLVLYEFNKKFGKYEICGINPLLDKEQTILDFIWFVLALTKRYTFRAFLLYRGNCSEPIIKEAFVP